MVRVNAGPGRVPQPQRPTRPEEEPSRPRSENGRPGVREARINQRVPSVVTSRKRLAEEAARELRSVMADRLGAKTTLKSASRTTSVAAPEDRRTKGYSLLPSESCGTGAMASAVQ